MLTRALIHRALSRLRDGQLTVVEAGATTVFGRPGGLAATVVVHDERVWSALVRHGSTGLGEAYADGWFDVDHIATFISIAHSALAPLDHQRDRVANALAPVRDRLPTRSRGKDADRTMVSSHYDLSNEMFSLMLDETMAYSCALFDSPAMTLHQAQEAKLDRLCRLLELGPDDHLLEIGTGWGGLAVHAAERFGCRVTTTTISMEQHDFAAKRVAAHGLTDRIEVLDLDYRDLTGTYSKIVSVEMIEAVDWRDHPGYFETLAARLAPGGRIALQAIVINDASFQRAKRQIDFVKAFIFPGGCLPSVASIHREAAAVGLHATSIDRIGHHYPETLRRWQANVDAHRVELAELGFDERFLRIWDLYLGYCTAAFERRHIDAVHVVLEA